MTQDLIALRDSIYLLFTNLYKLLVSICKKVYNFISPVADSMKGIINPEEFYRVIILSLSSGTGVWGSVDFVNKHLQDFVLDSNVVETIRVILNHIDNHNFITALVVLVFMLDYMRRKYAHGE